MFRLLVPTDGSERALHAVSHVMIVMATRGMGAASSLMLGSVATKVLHVAEVPVLMVP